MAGSAVFEWAAALIENNTSMTRLQARGTLRLVLGSAGLDLATLTGRQMRVVAAKFLPKELKARAVTNVDQLCAALSVIPPDIEAASGLLQTPEIVFARLGRKHDG